MNNALIDNSTAHAINTYNAYSGHFLVPPKLLQKLVGREQILEEIKSYLFSNNDVILYGLPGVGKTALIKNLVEDDEVQKHFPDAILWTGVGKRPDIETIIAKWGNELGILNKLKESTSLKDKLSCLHNTLVKKRALLIIDDIWSHEIAINLQQIGGTFCAHLITTRIPKIAMQLDGQRKKVKELDELIGLDLLKEISPDTVRLYPDLAENLVKSVGGLPLALIILGKYLNVESTSPDRSFRALTRLESSKKRLEIENYQSVLDSHLEYTNIPISLKTTIDISVESLTEEALDLFHNLSIFPPKPSTISEEAIFYIMDIPPEIFYSVLDLGLVEPIGKGRYEIHQTISDYSEDKITNNSVCNNFVMYYVSFVQRNKRNFDLIEQDIENIFNALDIASKQEITKVFVEAVNSLYDFLNIRGQYEKIQSLFEMSQQMADNNKDYEGQLKSLFGLARSMERQGKYADAKKVYEKALSISHNSVNKEPVAHILEGFGVFMAKTGNTKQAEKFLLQGLTIARNLNNPLVSAELMKNLGAQYARHGCHSQSEEYLTKALDIVQNKEEKKTEVSILLNFALLYLNCGVYEKAETYIKKGLEKSCHLKYYDRIAFFKIYYSRLFLEKGKYDDAENLLKESIEDAEKGSSERICQIFAYLSDCEARKGNIEKAQNILQNAISISSKINNLEIISLLLIKMGWLKIDQKNYESALASFKDSLTKAKLLNYRFLVSESLNGIGEVYLHLDKIQEAEEYFLESSKVAEMGNLQILLGSAYWGLAKTSLQKKDIIQVKRYGENTIKIFKYYKHIKGEKIKTWFKDNGIE